MAPPPPRTPIQARHSAPADLEEPHRPSVETVRPVRTNGLGSASATVLREHQRRMRQMQQSSPPPTTAGTTTTTSQQQHSLAGRLKRKFQQMAQHQFQTLLTSQENVVDENHGFPIPTTTTSPEASREFQDVVTHTLLHWMARGMSMDPERLQDSPALRELLQPCVQWMGNAPRWMQFAGLLAAKKCQEVSGELPREVIERTAAAATPALEWRPATTPTEETTVHEDHWMSIVETDPITTQNDSFVPTQHVEYIDVDASTTTPTKDDEGEKKENERDQPPLVVEGNLLEGPSKKKKPTTKTTKKRSLDPINKQEEEEKVVVDGVVHATNQKTKTKKSKKPVLLSVETMMDNDEEPSSMPEEPPTKKKKALTKKKTVLPPACVPSHTPEEA